jgi:ADP-ribosylglycohydrolase
MTNRIESAILASLISDRYSLGSHWVYDEEELKNLDVNWETLNAPQSLWHRGKKLGDMTHYGDQTLFLVEFLKTNGAFNKEAYYEFWKEKMSNYSGYIDGSSREAMQSIGASSNDLSICGRITPLLLYSKTKEDFLANVSAFVSITHNSELALNASAFFAELLWDSHTNEDTVSLINKLKTNYPMFKAWINDATMKKDESSFESIREFGPACGINGGFAGVIYLLLQDESFKELMILNAKAGGDSSARGMVVAMILGIRGEIEFPEEWIV